MQKKIKAGSHLLSTIEKVSMQQVKSEDEDIVREKEDHPMSQYCMQDS